ncbi:glycoside hydrolase family 6 protein [Nocardioides sp.]|uniref:glycoside hydrolase family 6 protein n=1 Tax=Nocardioides sp. TaxID=35761 RepID=UPI0026380355|nr:glycoside hydrolase family 6 protein [Nocardioides sp.]
MRSQPRTYVLAGLLATAGVLLSACGSTSTTTSSDPTATSTSASTGTVTAPPTGNPFTGRQLWVDPDSKAAQAAATVSGHDQELVQRIADIPTAVWLTPENLPVTKVGPFVDSDITQAAGQLPVFVVYGIPDRDCTGWHSSGGLDATSYLTWVREIAGSLRDAPVVVLEPDALASAQACHLVEQREQLLSAAIDLLAPHASVYVDAGHSSWIAPETMAQMLSVVGVERARGFAVNVSSYGSDAAEQAYADAVRTTLPETHYVIDTSRNGRGGNGDWCNPTGQALGVTPAGTGDDSGLDAHLWIKPPGESDGTCHGGPAAGTFWTERAVELATNAGW